VPAAKRPNVDAHPLVKALVPDPSKPPTPSVKLIGLPGDSPDSGATRLWLDESLTAYVDVPTASVLHSQVLPDDAGTILWVARDAQLTYGTVATQSAEASFLSGQITSSHMAGAAAAAGVAPTPITPRPSLVMPCPSTTVPCQVSFHFTCPTPTALHTHLPPCPSLPICPSETMPPSHCAPCPVSIGPDRCVFSHPIWACPPSRANCPTFERPCPVSEFQFCPTPSVRLQLC
jgi:hypothetical protein